MTKNGSKLEGDDESGRELFLSLTGSCSWLAIVSCPTPRFGSWIMDDSPTERRGVLSLGILTNGLDRAWG